MKPTLIIVDDDEAQSDEIRRQLEGEFEIVAVAKDGYEAVEACLVHSPQLVVMDVAMPRMGGIEAARRIAGEALEPPIIVMLSGIVEDDVVMQALEAGAWDYLVKPVSGDTLRHVLHGLLKHAA